MTEQKQQKQTPQPTELEEQNLDKAVGGRKPVGPRPRTSCPCTGGE